MLAPIRQKRTAVLMIPNRFMGLCLSAYSKPNNLLCSLCCGLHLSACECVSGTIGLRLAPLLYAIQIMKTDSDVWM